MRWQIDRWVHGVTMWYSPRMVTGPQNDTHPNIEARIVEGYRAMSPAQKFDIVCALTRAVQELALMDIRRRHPGAGQRELVLRLASRSMDPELLKRAFGWDVRIEGY